MVDADMDAFGLEPPGVGQRTLLENGMWTHNQTAKRAFISSFLQGRWVRTKLLH
jgi:hypothetical protein